MFLKFKNKMKSSGEKVWTVIDQRLFRINSKAMNRLCKTLPKSLHHISPMTDLSHRRGSQVKLSSKVILWQENASYLFHFIEININIIYVCRKLSFCKNSSIHFMQSKCLNYSRITSVFVYRLFEKQNDMIH